MEILAVVWGDVVSAWTLTARASFISTSSCVQAAGFYHKLSTRPSAAYRNFNTWMGDPIRAMQAATQIRCIREHGLVEHTARVGDKLYQELTSLVNAGGKIHNLRGKGDGTFIAWDMTDAATRDKLLVKMRSKGVNMAGCGDRTVRLRPMLVFGESHAEVLMDKLREAVKEI